MIKWIQNKYNVWVVKPVKKTWDKYKSWLFKNHE
jgi:hypothetical protein